MATSSSRIDGVESVRSLERRDTSIPADGILRSGSVAFLVGICYYLGTRIGLALTPHGQPNSTFWPPNAILLAVLLLAPRRTWWTFILAVLPAHLFAQLPAGVPLWTAIGWFITNISEALIGAYFITRFSRGKTFQTVRGVLAFVVFGVLIAPLATSFFDAAAVVVTGWGRHYWPLSTQRFWTNALAELTIVPAIVICGSGGVTSIRKATFARWGEAIFLGFGTMLVTILVFGSQLVSPARAPALLYAPLPLLLWAAARFGPGGLSLSVLCTALISMWYTIHGLEAFPSASMEQNVLSLQILLCIATVPLLFLSALMSEARHTAESLRNLSVSLIDAQEQERHRIAGELHDELGQELALAKVQLDGLIEDSNESLKSGLTALSDQLSVISDTAREISHGLYPRQLEYVGLATAVKRLCDEVGRGKHLTIRLALSPLPQLQPPTSLCLYRVVQEALHNVMKHSLAKNVDVQLGADDRRVLLQIIDDGVGFDLSQKRDGLGLHSMRERVRSVGGAIEIASSPKNGTRIEVEVNVGHYTPDDLPRVSLSEAEKAAEQFPPDDRLKRSA
jgi:signal transduction histidine kinase